MTLAKTALIIHGTGGSPEGNWFPWLKLELEKEGWKVLVPRFPTPEGQSIGGWLDAFDRAALAAESIAVLIGHSMGAAFALRLMEKRNIQPQGTFLAAGFLGEIGNAYYDRLNASFLADPFDWGIIKARAGRVFCYSGDNDPYVPLKLGLELAVVLGTEPMIIKDGGHLNAEFGFTKFETLLRDVLSLERMDGKQE